MLQLGVQPNRIDVMTSISGVTFEEAREQKRKWLSAMVWN